MGSETLTVLAARRTTPAQEQILVDCALSFWGFLNYWQFKNRETGAITTFARLWHGQADLADAMEEHPWLFVLKAGKLGFSELECAYDGWIARFHGGRNARVHLFSRSLEAARELLGWVKFGLEHLPEWMRLPVVEDEAGAETSTSLKLYAGPDDVRTIVSYAAGAHVSIDQSCTHAHVDEFARMPFGEKMWQAIETTVSPFGGTCHIVTRGSGPGYAARLWRSALAGASKLHAFFAPYDARPGRSEAWYEQEAQTLTQIGIWQYAPRTWQEAIQGDESYVYPQFDNPPGRHVKTSHPCALHECEKIAIGIDPGAVNPTAMGIWGERTSGGIHLYDEFYRPGIGADEIGAQLAEWWERFELVKWYERTGQRVRVAVPSDEKTLIPTLAQLFRELAVGYEAVEANRAINFGIQMVTTRLNTDALSVWEGCVHHIEEFQDYRNSTATDQKTRVEYAGDRPLKHHADAMDEMRYAVLQLAQWPAAPVVKQTASGYKIRAMR